MMHVFVALDAEAALVARDRVAEQTEAVAVRARAPAAVPDHGRFELYVGDAAAVDVVAAGFASLLDPGA